MFGCHGAITPPLHERWPHRFGGHEVPRCPFALLRRPDAWRDEVLGMVQDYRAGLLAGWPDRFTAATVDAVRYVLAESDACSAELMEAR